MATRPDTSTYERVRSSTIILVLFAFLAALIAVAAPPSQAADGPIQVGPEDGACTTFYFNYVDADGVQHGVDDYYRLCKEPAQGSGPGQATRTAIPALNALDLHISCSDPFDVPVYEDGDPTKALLGFTSDQGSDLDGLLVAPKDDGTGTMVADFAILRKVGSSGFRECGNFPLPDDPEDPDTASAAVVKTVDGDALTQSDPVFSFTLFARDEVLETWVPVSTESTDGDVEWDDLLLGDHLLCETGVPEGYTTTWPADDRFTGTTHGGDSCVEFELLETDDPLTVNVDNETESVVGAGLGTITITKDVVGDRAPDDAQFVFSIDCGDAFSESGIELGDGGEYTTDAIEAGTECTVTETGTGDALIITVDGASGTSTDATVPDGDTVTVAFVNDFGDEGVLPGGPGDRVDEREDDVVEAVLPVAIDAGTGGLANSGIPVFIVALMALGFGALTLGGSALVARKRI